MFFYNRLNLFGENSIEVQVKSYGRLFFEEILTPFYIFQIAACILWMLDSYYYYAVCIIVISLISMILSLFETKRVIIFCFYLLQVFYSVRINFKQLKLVKSLNVFRCKNGTSWRANDT